MTQADSLRLFVIAAVWSIIGGILYIVVTRPSTLHDLRTENEARNARIWRGGASLFAGWVVALGLFTSMRGYPGPYGALFWMGLLNCLGTLDHSTFYPAHFRRSLRWMAGAHVPSLLGILGGWADYMGWIEFPRWVFYALCALSTAGFAYVAATPIRRTRPSKRKGRSRI